MVLKHCFKKCFGVKAQGPFQTGIALMVIKLELGSNWLLQRFTTVHTQEILENKDLSL